MNIRNRFILSAGAVLLVVIVLGAVVARNRLVARETVRAEEELFAAAEAARTIVDENSERLAVQTELLAEVLPLSEAVVSGERGRVLDLLERFGARHRDLSFLAVATPGGDVLASAGRQDASPALLELGARAARGAATRGTTLVDGHLATFATQTVRDPVAGTPVAGLLMGEAVPPETAELLARLTGTEVVFLADGSPVVSTLPLGTGPEAERLSGALAPGEAQVVEIGGRSFLARIDPLASAALADAPARPVDGLLLLRRLEYRGTPAAFLFRDLLVAGLVGLTLAGGLVWMGSRRLRRALDGLAGAMAETATTGRLVHGSVEGLDARWAGTEVEDLRTAFCELMRTVEDSLRDRERSYVEAIGAVVAAIDARDHETTGHSFRVAHYALALAGSLGMEGDPLRAIEWGALLHDVGKIAIPDAILRKTGRLTEDEWHVMRQHPSWGFEMLADVQFLEPALEIVYSHHERWDGGGYPRGLRGGEIPLAARIFAVVDTYDSITSDRPYRRARAHGEAITELCRVAGTQLDPEIVEAFIRLPEVELRRLRERSSRLDLKIRIPDAVTELRVVTDTPGR